MKLRGKTLYAYVAGIVDGEGSVDIYKVNTPAHNSRYAMRLIVGITEQWLPQFLKFNFGGSVNVRESNTPKHKDCWVWSVAAIKAAKVLRLILPYLQIKKPQAELALSFQSRKVKRHAPLSENENILEEADRILMSSYNKRGKLPKEVT